MIFYVPKFKMAESGVYEDINREYFDHSNICGIDKDINSSGCIITLSNGRRIECVSEANDVANAIAQNLRDPSAVSQPIRLEI